MDCFKYKKSKDDTSKNKVSRNYGESPKCNTDKVCFMLNSRSTGTCSK